MVRAVGDAKNMHSLSLERGTNQKILLAIHNPFCYLCNPYLLIAGNIPKTNKKRSMNVVISGLNQDDLLYQECLRDKDNLRNL